MGDVDLDPAHLRSFLAIVDFGGYHRAAEALHLTQPAVSRHMRRLEEQLGEPLFARRGRGVELTPYGERADDVPRAPQDDEDGEDQAVGHAYMLAARVPAANRTSPEIDAHP